MILSKVDSILSKHPFFKTLSTDRKIGIYNKIYTKIFYIRSDITIINPVTYSSDKSYLLYHKYPDFVNLSAQQNVDSLMNEDSLLKNLTDEQKIVVFEIAAYRINMYRTLREDQEYYFSTHKPESAVETKTYSPILNVISRILAPVVSTIVYSPIAVVNGLILTLLKQTKYYEPALVVSTKFWGTISKNFIYIPLLNATSKIIQTQNITDIYLPSLVVSTIFITASAITQIYSPILTVSTDIIVDEVDYTVIDTYSPSLTVTTKVG
jgi:hypothetical protein